MELPGQFSENDHIDTAVRAVTLADYAAAQLRKLSDDLAARAEPGADNGIHVGHTEQSLSVWFRQPRREIVAKYSLSCFPLNPGGIRTDFCHIYTMPHASQELVDELITDLYEPGAFDRTNDRQAPALVAELA